VVAGIKSGIDELQNEKSSVFSMKSVRAVLRRGCFFGSLGSAPGKGRSIGPVAVAESPSRRVRSAEPREQQEVQKDLGRKSPRGTPGELASNKNREPVPGGLLPSWGAQCCRYPPLNLSLPPSCLSGLLFRTEPALPI
jgi:hypothetical protein